ncbi:hypothetical protein QQS21_009444 [Conoideocrella luteorostrata]|uniref:HCNGP-domain-containing protein n=1 Tax=Conoideocrella luteorostrata TaxID=1105319 RepID=A0AAJ0FQA4_9HYPO|nr:hypothetical protein QQS21_009444 [Conoideocrella luteorostrata]
MAGLVSYMSSDEEDETLQHETSPTQAPGNKGLKTVAIFNESPKEVPAPTCQTPNQQEESSQPTIGPVPLGPSLPPPDSNLPPSLPSQEPSAPSSPYTSQRALIHDLTLPSIPNLTIPPSPSGSPPRITNEKFQQFLDLKRKGIHFNTKLESSTALRNPSLTDKLLSFADLSGLAQYETTLPLDLYDPSGFPEWAYREKLRRSREALVKEREGEKAGVRGVDFVSSTSTTPGGGGGLLKGEKRKGGWK